MSGSEAAKRAAAEVAAALVEDGMLVGLGSGSTVRHLVLVLGRRVREERLRIVGIPTSVETETLAQREGIPLAQLGDRLIDLAIDGADEIERGTLRLIKGLGGALLREKIVVESSRRFVVIGDTTKVVNGLGERAPLPVEVVQFAHARTAQRLADLGGQPLLRCEPDGTPFRTDGGNAIYHCAGFAPIRDPFTLQRDLRSIAGVVETGLFLECAERAIVASPDGEIVTMWPDKRS